MVYKMGVNSNVYFNLLIKLDVYKLVVSAKPRNKYAGKGV